MNNKDTKMPQAKFSAQHYNVIAKILGGCAPKDEEKCRYYDEYFEGRQNAWLMITSSLMNYFQKDNPRFDPTKFQAFCERSKKISD